MHCFFFNVIVADVAVIADCTLAFAHPKLDKVIVSVAPHICPTLMVQSMVKRAINRIPLVYSWYTFNKLFATLT